ncbi:MAG: TonB-dependent receptor [Sphingopyxis sp.]|nr:TonB-dependent receptor [Sphingopyxis sp.]
MHIRHYLAASVAAISFVAVAAAPAHAQQITSGIEGQVIDESGNALNGATVVVTDTRTGSVRTLTTDGSGSFRADSLTTGGPYSVTATADGFEGQTVEAVNINLQGNSQLQFTLTASADGGIIVVTGTRARLTQLAIGPGSSIGSEELESLPSLTRDIRDIIRIDPRVSLDRDNEVDRISCLGGNDRANAFSVDGIIQADVFGLNGTPFASRNSLPLPFDTIAETSIEFAPFDVQYGAFTGCAINVVTKSGSNRFSGSAFFTYTGDSLQGDTIDGTDFTPSPFNEYRWGATLAGPIIKDRLFFSFGYEETDTADSQDDGPIGAGFANERGFITEAAFNEISSVLSGVYGIDTGPIARSLPETNRRFFGRIDAYITEGQRLELSYQRLDEQNVEPDDQSNEQFTGLNSYEDEGTVSDYYSLRLYSQWTDNFSTQVRLSRSDVRDVQGPVGGGEAQSDNPIPRIIVGVTNPANGQSGTLLAGPGQFRSANELQTQIDQLRVQASLVQGDHDLLFGVDINSLDVFNLFAVNATGTLFFQNVAALREGLANSGTQQFPNTGQINSGASVGAIGNFTASGDINEAAAEFNRTIWSVFAQDKWQATPQLNILAGVRIDWYDGDAPRNNPAFAARYGFSNAVPFSVLDATVLPRLGFTYNLENEGFFKNTQIKGGVGIFTGGDPVVYFSNAFSNNGFSTGQGNTGVASCFPAGSTIDVVTGGQFTGIPQCVRTNGSAQSAAGLADTQSTDPNFEVPTVLRANIGVATRFGAGEGFFDNWNLNLDYIFSRFRNPLNFVDLAQVVDPRQGLNWFTIDGRPIFRAIDPTAAGCTARLVGTGGTPPTFTNVNTACFTTSRDDEIQLTNGPNYSSHVASVVLSKRFDGGVFTEGGSTLINFGYAFTNADNNRFNNSSTATSSFDIVATFDRQDPAIATSEFETRHNFTFSGNFTERFFEDYRTRFGFVFVAREGRPYSVTWNNGSVFNDSASGVDNALLYVPTGINDPNLSPTSTAASVAALEAFVAANPCVARFRGQSVPRNSCRNDWFYDLDIRFSQEVPGPGRFFGLEDKLELFVDFDNILNLVDDGANVFRRFGFEVSPVGLSGVDSAGRYIVGGSNETQINAIQTSSSLWRVQFGVNYKF